MLTWLRQFINVICFGCIAAAGPVPALEPAAASTADHLAGRILLQVEANGEAWYVYPPSGQRYFLNRPHDAFAAMRTLSLGISNEDFTRVQNDVPERLRGLILLKPEDDGRAYYVYPPDGSLHYLGRPADAFRIMRELSLGITDADLATVPIATVPPDAAPGPLPERVVQTVPFAAQAPFGDWSDVRQQDGCEEASALMAVRWARGETLTNTAALAEIIAAADYQKKEFDEFRDTSAQDTATRIIKGYFGHDGARVATDVTVADIKTALAAGNVVIAPFDGQLLHNPNFTPPGPIRHMAVIIGYDDATDEFIVNDPGTRRGAAYRYPMTTLFTALRDYPTGHHEPITSLDKTIIIVQPQPDR